MVAAGSLWLGVAGSAVAGDVLNETWHPDALAETVELRAEAPGSRSDLEGLSIVLVERIPDRLAASSVDLSNPSGEEVRRATASLSRSIDFIELERLLDFYEPPLED